MATVTNVGHVNNAIRLAQRVGNIYIGIGGSVAWPNENKPPEEDIMTNEIPNLIGMKRAEVVSIARLIPDDENFNGTHIEYGGKRYELVPQSKAYEKQARFVYISATIAPDELSSDYYRVVGLLTNPIFKDGITGDVVPAESIISQGNLEMYENRKPVDRTSLKINEQFIIEA